MEKLFKLFINKKNTKPITVAKDTTPSNSATLDDDDTPTTPPSPRYFTWDKEMIDEYGKPITLAQLLILQQTIRDYILKEQEEKNKISSSPSPK